jgi:hypothetical protein
MLVGNVIHGENSDREIYSGACYNEHAEMSALVKLIKTNNYKRKLISVNLLVIKTDKSLRLKNSKPCSKCIEYMSLLPQYGYRMKYVYYSNASGDIVKVRFNDLCHDENVHVSQRFNKNITY